jgi:hypothetical protein
MPQIRKFDIQRIFNEIFSAAFYYLESIRCMFVLFVNYRNCPEFIDEDYFAQYINNTTL